MGMEEKRVRVEGGDGMFGARRVGRGRDGGRG